VYRALLRVLAGQFQAYNLIARTIKLEVASADEEGTLFRSNSAAAKLFTLYMRMIALKYLFHVLVLSVRSLHDNAIDTDASSTRTSHYFFPESRCARSHFVDEQETIKGHHQRRQQVPESLGTHIRSIGTTLTATRVVQFRWTSWARRQWSLTLRFDWTQALGCFFLA